MPGVREEQPSEERVRRPKSESWLPLRLTLGEAESKPPNESYPWDVRIISGKELGTYLHKFRRPESLFFTY